MAVGGQLGVKESQSTVNLRIDGSQLHSWANYKGQTIKRRAIPSGRQSTSLVDDLPQAARGRASEHTEWSRKRQHQLGLSTLAPCLPHPSSRQTSIMLLPDDSVEQTGYVDRPSVKADFRPTSTLVQSQEDAVHNAGLPLQPGDRTINTLLPRDEQKEESGYIVRRPYQITPAHTKQKTRNGVDILSVLLQHTPN